MPAKIVWISDPHLTETGHVEGVDCRDRLSAAVAEIRAHHSDAICCVATGDLADTGSAAEYAIVRSLLDDLPMPLLPVIGNHDRRAEFRAAFAPPGEAMETYQQFRWDWQDLSLICLDSHVPGVDHGALDAARLDWLAVQLEACRGRRVLIFMHHPPGRLFLGPLDDMPLRDEGPLIGMLGAAPEVEYLFCGHVHRPVSGVIGGLPFTTLRALAHQTRPPHTNWDWEDFTAPAERPQYGVILVDRDRVIVQANDLEMSA